MADAAPDLRALFPVGARVVMTAEGVRQFPRSAWAGTVAGYSLDGQYLHVRALARKSSGIYPPRFWRLVDPPAAED